MKNYKVIFEDKERNDLFEKVKSFNDKKEAGKYAKEYISNTSDNSTYFRIIKL